MSERIVLVGGGVANATAAGALRRGGYDGSVVLVSADQHVPYERPPLSKEYLAGSFATTDFEVQSRDWYADHDIELRLGAPAESIDPATHRVTVDGEQLRYDALVLATGVRSRRLPGFDGEHVHYLRDLADSDRLRESLVPGRRLAVLGAGFVGCEVAAIAAAAGVQVTVFEPEPLPMARALGPEFGTAMMGIHAEHDVRIRTGEIVQDISETADGVRLRTADGGEHVVDDVLVGVGSVPNTEIAASAGIAVDGGIVTDEYGRTSAQDVYAIGDVAVRLHPSYGNRVRVEHHDTAMRHGTNVARNLLGERVAFTEEHYFWSDQYDHSVKSIGHNAADAQKVLRGSVDDRSFSVFSVAGSRVTGVITLDQPRDLMATRKLLGAPHEVSVEQLADSNFDLRMLLRRADPARTRRRATA